MNRRKLKLITSLALVMMISCNEPETIVTNFVHPDGTVTRQIEMRNNENKFKLSDLQVPFNSTWAIKDTVEINEKGDTTWIKTAKKLFKKADEINRDYQTDSGANKEISRRAKFTKKFRWFNTEYRFAEIIDKEMSYGYPIAQFLNKDELAIFYSPESLKDEKKHGPDSLKYRAFEDTIKSKTDRWFSKNLVSEWIGEFARLTEGKTGKDLSGESLKAREDEIVKIVDAHGEKFDSLWAKGVILKEIIGENNSIRFRTEADTALAKVTSRLFVSFKDYSVRIIMPGKIIGTNGFIDKTEILLWPVKSDYFMTEPYEMYAESKMSNKWAWIVSGIFLLFVISGLIIRIIRKK